MIGCIQKSVCFIQSTKENHFVSLIAHSTSATRHKRKGEQFNLPPDHNIEPNPMSMLCCCCFCCPGIVGIGMGTFTKRTSSFMVYHSDKGVER
mmetsp:Transcript_65467/g.73314  ORF Transcript_65467/g.73314 Transcript_65467/m.73314 type:complete len:93 (-) Transcript_65467:200-478(-)